MFSSIPKGSGLRYSTHSVSDFSSLPRLCKRLTSRFVGCPACEGLATFEALRLLTLRPKSSRLEGCRWCPRALSMPFPDEASVVLRWMKNPPLDRTRTAPDGDGLSCSSWVPSTGTNPVLVRAV